VKASADAVELAVAELYDQVRIHHVALTNLGPARSLDGDALGRDRTLGHEHEPRGTAGLAVNPANVEGLVEHNLGVEPIRLIRSDRDDRDGGRRPEQRVGLWVAGVLEIGELAAESLRVVGNKDWPGGNEEAGDPGAAETAQHEPQQPVRTFRLDRRARSIRGKRRGLRCRGWLVPLD